jgi:hypothetical protein
MIEKKIKYDINIEKPSNKKPVKQGGVFNYLGKQKTVNAPVKWRSSKDHPIAHLSYITKDEEKILIDLNLYGSLKGKPNRGPFGLPSLQGSGGGSGGDGGDGGGDGGSSGGDGGDGGVAEVQVVQVIVVQIVQVIVVQIVQVIVVQEDQMMELDTEDQDQETVAQEDQMMGQDTEDQGQEIQV